MHNINDNYVHGRDDLPPIVFIHGDFQNHTYFQKIEKIMQELGHTTLSFDLPGHGLSGFPEDKNFVSLLDDLIKERKLQKPIIIGNSSGGILAVDYATKIGNLSCLVLLNSPLSSPRHLNLPIDLDSAFEYYKKLSRDNFKKQELIDYADLGELNEDKVKTLGLNATNPEGFENYVNFYMPLPDNKEIFEIDVPILFIVSTNDSFVSLDYAKDCVNKMKKGKLEVVEGSHNILTIDPKKIEDVIEQNYSFLGIGRETL